MTDTHPAGPTDPQQSEPDADGTPATTGKSKAPRWRMLLGVFVGALFIMWGLLLVVAQGWGRSIIYQPPYSNPDHIALYARLPQWHVDHAHTADGIELVGVVRSPDPAQQQTAPWVVFWGGNAAGLTDNADAMDVCRHQDDWGISVHAYRGYDGSTGQPEEAGIVADANRLVAALIDNQIPASRMVLAGQSLGTGVAVQVAAAMCKAGTPPAGLVLVSPFRSMAAMFDQTTWPFPVGFAAPDTWRSDSHVDEITCPVLIIHGDADTLITVSHGRTMAAAFGSRATLVEVERAGHNNIWRQQSIDRVHQFVNACVPSPPATD